MNAKPDDFNVCKLTTTDGEPYYMTRTLARKVESIFEDNGRTAVRIGHGNFLYFNEAPLNVVRAIESCVNGVRPAAEPPKRTPIPIFSGVNTDILERVARLPGSIQSRGSEGVEAFLRVFLAATNGNRAPRLREAMALIIEELPVPIHEAPGDE